MHSTPTARFYCHSSCWAKHLPAAGADEHRAVVEEADEDREVTSGRFGSFLKFVSFCQVVFIIDWICEPSTYFRSAAS
jgi:hypothetical protein